jgi:hypothetical protein
MRLSVIVASVAIAAIGWIGLTLSAAGCTDNVRPGTTRADVCSTTGLSGSSSSWSWDALLYAFGPLLVFGALVKLLPVARRHVITTATVVAAVSIAAYAVVISLVSDD